MKLSAEELNGQQPVGRKSSVPVQENVKPFLKSELTLSNVEQSAVYLPYGRKYVESKGWQIASCMAEARRLRAIGTRAMTLREADIAARSHLPIDSISFLQMLVGADKFDFCIVEDMVGVEDDVYSLRAYYNKGIRFKKDGDYDRCSEERRIKADQMMASILHKLYVIRLPAWYEEERNGFPEELCKPEFQTFSEYQETRKRMVNARFIDLATGEERPARG